MSLDAINVLLNDQTTVRVTRNSKSGSAHCRCFLDGFAEPGDLCSSVRATAIERSKPESIRVFFSRHDLVLIASDNYDGNLNVRIVLADSLKVLVQTVFVPSKYARNCL